LEYNSTQWKLRLAGSRGNRLGIIQDVMNLDWLPEFVLGN